MGLQNKWAHERCVGARNNTLSPAQNNTTKYKNGPPLPLPEAGNGVDHVRRLVHHDHSGGAQARLQKGGEGRGGANRGGKNQGPFTAGFSSVERVEQDRLARALSQHGHRRAPHVIKLF